jgi:hypothetical protein
MTPGGAITRTTVTGAMTADQVKYSALLQAGFSVCLNSLGLKKADGSALAQDASGNGSFQDYVESYLVASAQTAPGAGTDLSSLGWISIEGGKVTDIDFAQYLKYATCIKTTSAFAVDLSNAENELFGTASDDARHFTQFGQDHDTAGGSFAEAALIRMMNPLSWTFRCRGRVPIAATTTWTSYEPGSPRYAAEAREGDYGPVQAGGQTIIPGLQQGTLRPVTVSPRIHPACRGPAAPARQSQGTSTLEPPRALQAAPAGRCCRLISAVRSS